MCSLGDADLPDDDGCMRPKDCTLINKICRKCNENRAEVILRMKHSYCRFCFVKAATHKFRASLGKSKIVRAGDNVMIAFSGSAASAALVHLVSIGLSEATHKRLCFKPSIVYVDEGGVLDLSHEQRKNVCNNISSHIENYQIPAFMTCIEAFFDAGELQCYPLGSDISFSGECKEKLEKLFDQIMSLTSKEDLLKIMRHKVLLRAAKALNCSKIFVADTATGLATTLLTNVSLGRGAHLSLDVGFHDDRDCRVQIIRPMHDFMKKEVVFYNIFNDVGAVSVPSLSTKVNAHGSIQKLTERFVMELQQDFPSTASVVFRTGEKLSMPRDIKLSDETCAICKAPGDDRNIKSSSLQATEFSRMTSQLGPAGFDTNSIEYVSVPEHNCCCNETKGVCQPSKTQNVGCNSIKDGCCCYPVPVPKTEIPVSDAEKCCCYGCRIILREIGSVHLLPEDIQANIRTQLSFKSMKNEIADFLL